MDGLAATIAENWARVAGAATFLLVVEMLVPASRYPLVSRLRGALFWTLYVVVATSVALAADRAIAGLGWKPLVVVPLGLGLGNGPVLDALSWVAAAIATAIFIDFFYYWFHRLQHAVPVLWKFHSVHHSIREMSAWNSTHHLSEEIFRLPFMILPLALLARPDPGLVPMAVWLVLGSWGVLIHSCTRFHLGPLRYVLGDNRFHRIHHSLEPQHFNRNFGGACAVWDVVFRTAHFPKPNEWPETGLADQPEATSLRDYVWRPFRRAAEEKASETDTMPTTVAVNSGAPS